LENNIIHIFYIKQTEKLPSEIFQQLLLQVPGIFREEILRYKFWQGAESSLLGKIILKFGLQQLNLPFSLNDIKVDAKDRPFLNDKFDLSLAAVSHKVDTATYFDFNISHSGNYIICAIAKNAKVGIDIEKHRELKSNIANRYFDKNECYEIDVSENSSKTFFDLWSLKESAIKCDGRGVEVLSKTHKQYQPKTINTIICDDTLLHYQPIEIEDVYSCCVCSNEKFVIELQQLNLTDMINKLIY